MKRIFAEKRTPRLEYVLDFLYREWVLDTQPVSGQEYHINYSTEPVAASHSIFPSGLLEETGDLRGQNYTCSLVEGVPQLKWNSTDRTDVLSAIFLMISGIDEWNSPKDEHGRPISKYTAPVKTGHQDLAMVDRWADSVGSDMDRAQAWPRMTFDIDHAYAFKGKPVSRMVPALGRDLLKGNRELLKARLNFLLKGKDPYDTYAVMRGACQAAGLRPILFFHVGDQAKWDRPVPYGAEAFVQLVKESATWADIGLHPSWRAAEDMDLLVKEKQRLERITGAPVIHSRQHFLRVIEGITYRNLEQAGIEFDHSLAYYDRIGFRAGTTHGFRWYDLEQERVSGLTLVPYAAMDGALNEYMGLTVEQADEAVGELSQREPNARFIWHNHSLAPLLHWQGWLRVFESTINS